MDSVGAEMLKAITRAQFQYGYILNPFRKVTFKMQDSWPTAEHEWRASWCPCHPQHTILDADNSNSDFCLQYSL